MQVKPLLQKTVIGLSCLSAAIFAEYQLPYKLNDKTRHLTSQEMAFAQEIFGSKIDYKKVTLHDGVTGMLTIGVDPAAVTWGNDIFIADGIDPKNIPPERLAHELTHVYQWQQDGQSGILRSIGYSILSTLTERDGYQALYNSSRNIEATFDQLNHEQQGLFVKEYTQNLASLIKESAEILAQTENKNAFAEKSILKIYASLLCSKKQVGHSLPLTNIATAIEIMHSIPFHGDDAVCLREIERILWDETNNMAYIQRRLHNIQRNSM